MAQTIGALIKEARLKHGNDGQTLSQEVLAERLGWPHHRVSRTEQDARPLRCSELSALKHQLPGLDVRLAVKLSGGAS